MKKEERDFLNEVKAVLDRWSYSYEYYHEHDHFCVDITIEDMNEWAENESDIWEALDEVAEDWGAGIDSDCNNYYLAIELD